jgi:hypothetical protein
VLCFPLLSVALSKESPAAGRDARPTKEFLACSQWGGPPCPRMRALAAAGPAGRDARATGLSISLVFSQWGPGAPGCLPLFHRSLLIDATLSKSVDCQLHLFRDQPKKPR